MGFKKRYLKSKDICKVTFKLPGESFLSIRTAHIVGEFNGWDTGATPMRRLKNGDFSVTLDLEKDREYQFRYLLDKHTWENDWDADRYEPTPFGDGENSIITL